VQTEPHGGGVVLLLCRGDAVVGSVVTSGWQGHGVLILGKEAERKEGLCGGGWRE
jgi:hypothetical protein